MKRWYVYIFSRDLQELNAGYCSDVKRTIANYKDLPSMNPDRPNRLIYLEEMESKEKAQQRFDTLIHMTKQAKIALIEQSNPDLVELIVDVNIFL